MDKNAILGELLYLLSRREKARIPAELFWKKKYVDSLKKSFSIMKLLVNLLKMNEDITSREILPVIEFFHEHNTVFANANNDYINEFTNNSVNLKSYSYVQEDCSEIDSLMDRIIEESILLLNKRKKKYKKKIFYLLMALHNLPRVYLNPKAETIYNIQEKSISVQEAIEYASSYLKIKDKLK